MYMVSKRAVISLLVGFAVYLLVTLIFATYFQPTQTFTSRRFVGMMGMAAPTVNYASYLITASLTSLFAGSVAGALTYRFYPEETEIKPEDEEPKYRVDDIVWGILNENEKKVLEEVIRSKGVTQDSLVHRLGYSKAKLSILLSDLEKKDLVMREKLGRTNSIILTERMKKVISKNDE